jgi:hypothetical protein
MHQAEPSQLPIQVIEGGLQSPLDCPAALAMTIMF